MLGQYLTKTMGNAGTYSSITGLTAGAVTTGTTSVDMIYFKNSLSPFREFKISDIGGTQIIDDIINPALYTQMNLTSQDQAFWSDTNLEADKYGAHVMKYRDPKYYCGKGNTTNQMVPSALIPKPANDSFGSGTSVIFPDVQRQQVECWPLSATGDDLGMPLIVYPVSDFLRTNEKLYCYFNKLLVQFFIDSYDNAMTDVHSTYLENSFRRNLEFIICRIQI